LDTGLAIGGVGVLILVLILIFGFTNYGPSSVLIIGIGLGLAGNLFVESMLERQAGIVFISWLIALLVSIRPIIRTLK
jgi:hypothetical protein